MFTLRTIQPPEPPEKPDESGVVESRLGSCALIHAANVDEWGDEYLASLSFVFDGTRDGFRDVLAELVEYIDDNL